MPPREVHPFPPFVPEHAKWLLLGTFPGKQNTQVPADKLDENAWGYAGRNQFWTILAAVYGLDLQTKAQKQALFRALGLAQADIIYACRRANNDNSDSNLIDIEYNTAALQEIFEHHAIVCVFCTSQSAAKPFRKLFPQMPYVVLPSPSPRYARMSLSAKIARYRELLPALPTAPTGY